MGILKRKDIIDRILACDAGDHVRLLKGVRGAGKTTVLKGIMEELKDRGVGEDNVFYFSLFSCHFRNMEYLEVYRALTDKFKGTEGRIYLLFDDVEAFGQWQSLLDSLRMKKNFEVIAAVNYAKLYRGDDRALGGKFISFEVYPFSFKEFVEYRMESGEEVSEIEDLFR